MYSGAVAEPVTGALSLRDTRHRASPVEARSLSPRENQCLLLVAEGQTSKEIARTVGITLRTVEFHIHNAMGKLGVTKRSQAALRLVMMSQRQT